MKKLVVTFLSVFAIVLAIACTSESDSTETVPTTDKPVVAVARVGQTAPAFTLTSATGQKHALADFKGKYIVLEWVNYDCPFVKKHYNSGNMQNLQKKYADNGVVWLSICSSAPGKQGHFEGQTLLDRIAAEKSNAAAYLIDADGTVGKMYAAKTTPHMYVIDPKGNLVYAGAIDDKPSTSTADLVGAENYVVAALDAALSGTEISTRSTTSYGCSVKY